MVRLVLFLLVIGLVLYTVARIMAVLRGDASQLPGPEEHDPDEQGRDESAGDITDESDDDQPPG